MSNFDKFMAQAKAGSVLSEQQQTAMTKEELLDNVIVLLETSSKGINSAERALKLLNRKEYFSVKIKAAKHSLAELKNVYEISKSDLVSTGKACCLIAMFSIDVGGLLTEIEKELP